MAELPGYVKEYVHVELTDNTLTLKAGCQHEMTVQEIAVSGPPAASAALLAPGSALRQLASGAGDLLLLVVPHTLGFTAADDACAFERPTLTGNHRALLFPLPPS